MTTAVLTAPASNNYTGLDDQPTKDGYFAFARIQGEVFLVQASYATPVSALTAVDVKVFRHEFISIFRFSEYRTLHPSDICILEPIDHHLTRYEEENETVFLARNVMERMRKLTDPRWGYRVHTQRLKHGHVPRIGTLPLMTQRSLQR
ncbi:hypothetical protein CVT26_003590 [Gymnopilus dilepis]|uniref:Uncharacterized protein n=1 Tax=Gymnopilus dilepis TaxID=231916 RepID=A0A409W1W8_9AGAR|nr:hypothetical protein CVT26_003590 [Gymnopilus dilepis]